MIKPQERSNFESHSGARAVRRNGLLEMPDDHAHRTSTSLALLSAPQRNMFAHWKALFGGVIAAAGLVRANAAAVITARRGRRPAEKLPSSPDRYALRASWARTKRCLFRRRSAQLGVSTIFIQASEVFCSATPFSRDGENARLLTTWQDLHLAIVKRRRRSSKPWYHPGDADIRRVMNWKLKWQ